MAFPDAKTKNEKIKHAHPWPAAHRPRPRKQKDKFGCRFCGNPLRHLFVDLGLSPLCQNVVPRENLYEMEPFYPLQAFVCEKCFLVQVHEHVHGREIFRHYAYFSSYSDSWLAHTKKYAEDMIERLGLNSRNQVIEIASNDGYMLRNFVEKGIPALGIEPAANVAEVARQKGVPTLTKYFGEPVARELAAEGLKADLLACKNVLAHVPDINDFVRGLKILLADGGVFTVETPHLMKLISENQFDTIYQEHYCYLSLITVETILAAHGLTVFDVEEFPTHGGSLRIYARHSADESKPVLPAVAVQRNREIEFGLTRLETYLNFAENVRETKRKLLELLIQLKREGRRIAAYGAPGKGVTLLNYCGIRNDFIDFTVDRNPMKQGNYLPGTRIPVYAPEKIAAERPDYILILPWNLKAEIMAQLDYVRQWGARFIIPIPEPTIID